MSEGRRHRSDRDDGEDRSNRDKRYRSRSRSPTRRVRRDKDEMRRRRSGRRSSRSESESDGESSGSDRGRRRTSGRRKDSEDSEEEERRRRKRRKEKERRRRREEEEEEEDKEERRRRKERKREKRERKEKHSAASTAQWGKYGLISEVDMMSKGSEFRAWLVEERTINPETIPKDRERKEFAVFVEDYNTATLPHEKFYDMDKYARKMSMVRSGQTLPLDGGGYDPLADMKAHSSFLKSKSKQQPESNLTRQQVADLRRIQAERNEIGQRKMLGLNVPRSLGVRTEDVP